MLFQERNLVQDGKIPTAERINTDDQSLTERPVIDLMEWCSLFLRSRTTRFV